MSRFKRFKLCMAVVAAACAGIPGAEDKPGEPVPQLDEKAVAVLRSAIDYLASAKSYSTVLTHRVVITSGPDKKREIVSKYGIAAEKPNKLALVVKEGELRCSLISDGKTMWAYAPPLKVYAEKPAPATLADLLNPRIVKEIQFVREDLSDQLFIDYFASPDALEIILDGVRSLNIAGVEPLGETKAYRLHFVDKDIDWDMWIQAGTQPLLRKLSFEGEKTTTDETGQVKVKKVSTSQFDEWKLQDVPAQSFVFTPAADAKKVPTFIDEPYDPKLLGEPAPALIGKLLEGGTLDLAALRSKNVVLLEFWATWCGPCQKSMPIVSEIADVYRSKGVASYAVNLKEPSAKVKEFKAGTAALTMPVVLDEDGKIAEAYRVQPIPMIVLIGKSGYVEALYLGLPNNLVGFKANLKAQLEALIEGKSLVKHTGETTPKAPENAKGEPEAN